MRFVYLIPILLILLIAVVLVSGCTDTTGDTTGKEEPTTGGEVREFEMTAQQWEFIPSTITVNKGDIVKLHITSIDVAHGFGLPDFGINERLEPEKTVDVEFVADKTGTFTFTCTVFCGFSHGRMKGQLIVI